MANELLWEIAEAHFQGTPLHELIDTYGVEEVNAALIANETVEEDTTDEELLGMRTPPEWMGAS